MKKYAIHVSALMFRVLQLPSAGVNASEGKAQPRMSSDLLRIIYLLRITYYLQLLYTYYLLLLISYLPGFRIFYK